MTDQERATTEEAPRCRFGASTPEPCPREATVVMHYDAGAEPTACAEHAAAHRFTDRELGYLEAERHLHKWLRKTARRAPESVLAELLRETIERAERGKEDNYKMLEAAYAVAGSYKDESKA